MEYIDFINKHELCKIIEFVIRDNARVDYHKQIHDMEIKKRHIPPRRVTLKKSSQKFVRQTRNSIKTKEIVDKLNLLTTVCSWENLS